MRTGVPLGAVKSKTARAFKSLRRELAPEDAAWEKGRGGASRKDRSPSSRQNTPLVLLAVVSLSAAGVALALLFASQPPGNDSAEAGFARDMIVHHAQAVQMAEIIRDKTKSDSMRLLALDISLTQQAQIGIMQGWLQVWGLRVTGLKPAMAWMGHPSDGLMPGMATPDELDRLFRLPPTGRTSCS